VSCQATQRTAQSALSSDRISKNVFKKLGLPLWSHLTGYSGYAVFPGNAILRIRVLENQ
jgi:hypothetical protein